MRASSPSKTERWVPSRRRMIDSTLRSSEMSSADNEVRVLYSFPHKIGAGRICYTAWQQVRGLSDAGARVLLFPGVVQRSLPETVRVRPTLARGRIRIPYRLLGRLRALALHDYIVARRIEKLAGRIDIVHAWPMAALRTLKAASRLGIPTVLERPNARTRFAYEVVRAGMRIGWAWRCLPVTNMEINETILRREEESNMDWPPAYCVLLSLH